MTVASPHSAVIGRLPEFVIQPGRAGTPFILGVTAALATLNLEGSHMPLKHMLDESRAFDPKAIAVLLKAFDDVVAELDLQDRTDRERAAKIVMQLATGQTNLDAAKLRGGALATMRSETRWRRPL